MATNIDENIGGRNSLILQQNGTARLKGFYPNVITNTEELEKYHREYVTPLISRYKENEMSRISERFLITDTVLPKLERICRHFPSPFLAQTEGVIPLDLFFEGERVHWVWIGANIKSRQTNETILSSLIKKAKAKKTLSLHTTIPEEYSVLLLGTVKRIEKIEKETVPKAVIVTEITDEYAQQIADLFKERFITYITDNANPHYIKNSIADNEDTYLFALLNNVSHTIEAVVANDVTTYPILFPDKKTAFFTVCESNDWVKKTTLSSSSFSSFLTISLQHAVTQNPHVIEAECMPQSFSTAQRHGFLPTSFPLLRTSHIKTHVHNPEWDDDSIPETYREFNSLQLFYINPQSDTWKKLMQKSC